MRKELPQYTAMDASIFGEAPAWQAIPDAWRPLFGSYQDLGFSFEWHDFKPDTQFDWARSFHPGSVELCLNLDGNGEFRTSKGKTVLEAGQVAFYHPGPQAITATRAAGERHQFVTVEYSPAFMRKQLTAQAEALHPLIRAVVLGRSAPSDVVILPQTSVELTYLIESLRRPPVYAPARRIWFASKATELAALAFFKADGETLFCSSAKRTARERVEAAQGILRATMDQPLNLDELGKRVGCSPSYLSRLFSNEVGLTIQQYLRQIRLERAAELLRTGKCNVTEAAMAVGYSSLSHFSAAFHQSYGCCPGLYPLQTPAQHSR